MFSFNLRDVKPTGALYLNSELTKIQAVIDIEYGDLYVIAWDGNRLMTVIKIEEENGCYPTTSHYSHYDTVGKLIRDERIKKPCVIAYHEKIETTIKIKRGN